MLRIPASAGIGIEAQRDQLLAERQIREADADDRVILVLPNERQPDNGRERRD